MLLGLVASACASETISDGSAPVRSITQDAPDPVTSTTQDLPDLDIGRPNELSEFLDRSRVSTGTNERSVFLSEDPEVIGPVVWLREWTPSEGVAPVFILEVFYLCQRRSGVVSQDGDFWTWVPGLPPGNDAVGLEECLLEDPDEVPEFVLQFGFQRPVNVVLEPGDTNLAITVGGLSRNFVPQLPVEPDN